MAKHKNIFISNYITYSSKFPSQLSPFPLSSLNANKIQKDENKRNQTNRGLDIETRCHGIPQLQNHTDESIFKRLCVLS